MLKKRCSLCGGNLARGKCIECGLDNTKKRMRQADDVMEGYKPWAKSSDAFGDAPNNDQFFEDIRKEQQEMEVEDVYHRRPDPIPSRPIKGRPTAKPNQPRRRPIEIEFPTGTSTYGNPRKNDDETKRKSKRLIIILAIFFGLNFILPILFSLFAMVASVVSGVGSFTTDLFEDTSTYEYEMEFFEEDFALAKFQNEELALGETGVSYEITLMDGFYEVGVHLPEGTYDIVCENCGTIWLDDEANQIYEYLYLESGKEGSTCEDVYLYAGTMIEIESSGVFCFVTENANDYSMDFIENPNTESYEVEAIATAGVDFPAGVYDLYVPDDSFSVVEIYLSQEGYDDESVYSVFSTFMSNTHFENDDEYQTVNVYNVVIPEGAVIITSNDEEYMEYLLLTPSPVIADEDYASFYE